ncbi:MAG: hypothetical protein QNL62_16870 [Gammaproteobacteria bacterium]|nr:hypothetical protein [Gammaproteobacteria bacterium]
MFIYFASLLKIFIELSLQQAIFRDFSWQALPQVSLDRIYYRHVNCTDNIPGKEAIC